MTNQQWLEKVEKRVEALVEKEVFVSCSALMRSLDASDEIEFYGDFQELHDDGQIKQYWIVSDFLHEKLYNVGAVVMEYKNLKIWGRTETALTESHALKDIAWKFYINMDGVIK